MTIRRGRFLLRVSLASQTAGAPKDLLVTHRADGELRGLLQVQVPHRAELHAALDPLLQQTLEGAAQPHALELGV